jgi:hypothetical protein
MTNRVLDESVSVLAELEGYRDLGYGSEESGRADDLFLRLNQCFRALSESERDEVRAVIPNALWPLLLGFSDRFSVAALRHQDDRLLTVAASAHGLEDGRLDLRETLLRLAVLFDASARLGQSVQQTSEMLAAVVTPRMGAVVRDFAQRPAQQRSLRGMGIEYLDSPNGPKYRYSR